MENVRFSNVTYDKDCRPLPDDEHIFIEWNNTRSDGYSCVYCNGTNMTNVKFQGIACYGGMDSVFGGWGSGTISCSSVYTENIAQITNMDGIKVIEQ